MVTIYGRVELPSAARRRSSMSLRRQGTKLSHRCVGHEIAHHVRPTPEILAAAQLVYFSTIAASSELTVREPCKYLTDSLDENNLPQPHLSHHDVDYKLSLRERLYRRPNGPTAMRVRLVWGLCAKSMRYRPPGDLDESQSVGRLVLLGAQLLKQTNKF